MLEIKLCYHYTRAACFCATVKITQLPCLKVSIFLSESLTGLSFVALPLLKKIVPLEIIAFLNELWNKETCK